jgi:hypothetical protein
MRGERGGVVRGNGLAESEPQRAPRWRHTCRAALCGDGDGVCASTRFFELPAPAPAPALAAAAASAAAGAATFRAATGANEAPAALNDGNEAAEVKAGLRAARGATAAASNAAAHVAARAAARASCAASPHLR